jgi:hypothetical protein
MFTTTTIAYALSPTLGLGLRLTTPRARGSRYTCTARGVRRAVLTTRASDDEMVPIISGHTKKGFTEKEYEKLRNPDLLGGKTVGEELALIRQRHLQAEAEAEQRHKATLSSSQWDGDVYIGGRWNVLSILYLVFLLTPAAVGLFAYLSYGHLWGVSPGLYN